MNFRDEVADSYRERALEARALLATVEAGLLRHEIAQRRYWDSLGPIDDLEFVLERLEGIATFLGAEVKP